MKSTASEPGLRTSLEKSEKVHVLEESSQFIHIDW